MARRLSVSLLLAALVVALVPSVASASVTGMCDGEAKIKGETYTPANDTPSSAIPIPNEDGVQVTYSGSVGFENKGHEGAIKVQVGPFNIEVGDWEGSNEADERGVTDKIYELDDFRDELPIWIPGVWRVSGEHSASGGDCSGFAMIKLEGAALGNVVGWIALLAFVALVYVAVKSALRRRVFAAAFAALFAGFFLALLIMMFGIRPLDTLTTVIIPIVLAVIAAVVAVNRPRPVFH